MEEETRLFPVIYNGKEYYEKDCSSGFLAYYHCKEALNPLGGVYIAEGIWIYLNGTMKTY